jgi:methionyl-tRNA synthetase
MIFITSTLPYANSYRPHIGHLFEFILTDSISRFYKSLSHEKVFFNLGLDQNGTKILQKARELNISLPEFLSKVTHEWKQFCELFHINYDNFYETSSQDHETFVKEQWIKLLEKGDIYQKEYTGKYCIGCESFKLDKDLVDGKCSDHPTTEIETISEINYFFNLGKYKDSLINWLNRQPIEPVAKTNELINFINEYDEISVSRKRTSNSLGIEVPNDSEQVIYVWFDALLNYINAANKFGGWDNFKVIQTCGPDNLRFQGQIFQSFCIALGKDFSSKILVHGTILDKDGKKMSKTLGNVKTFYYLYYVINDKIKYEKLQ